ncbi:hypothetical protein FIU85_01400 [Roseovarius sp. THAF8]|uniref:hypothetical protein n=1 Tax=Roseovarius sp. THAF8 TaxID=2587846 RepID=UPI00126784A2|nr:hypothetical protein [Roseovarius sp. THAF8]QFT95948.1 hypothetical protein FIU85_01400 [Roseovarius sp. THAF8]
MSRADHIVSAIRHWKAVENGTYRRLFQYRTDLAETPDGPPIYKGEGYVFLPTGETVTVAEFEAICEALEAPVAVPEAAPAPAAPLTTEDRRRNSLRARSDAAARKAGGL